jgi:aliphatic nitrilase
MGDSYPKIKVAAVQAASVFLDREGSTEKACRLIREAGRNGAQLIGFPEGFVPAHPVWYHNHSATGALSNRLAIELFKNAVTIPGPEIVALSAAAQDANAYVVVGVCGGLTLLAMFNTQVYLGPTASHWQASESADSGREFVHTGGWRYLGAFRPAGP